MAPLAAGAESATPLAPGVLSSTAPADLAATELTGPVGLPAAAGTTPSGGMISATTAPAMQSAPMAKLNNVGVPMNMADSIGWSRRIEQFGSGSRSLGDGPPPHKGGGPRNPMR